MIGSLALALGAFVSLFVYNNLQAKNKSGNDAGVDVIVAANDIQVGARVELHDVHTAKLPPTDLPQGVYSKPSQVLGRGVIIPIAKGEFILPSKLAPENAGSGLPSLIPPGMRAVSVRVNEVVSVAGFVTPGTRVDVLATVSPSGQQGDMTSKVILTNVQVLAAGTKIERDTDKNKPIAVSVVTMLVSPEESERLTLASTEGKIQLALRNPLDKTIPTTPGVRPSALFGFGAATRTAVARTRVVAAGPSSVIPVVPAEPVLPTVEIIRGDKRAHEVVRQEQ